MTEFANVRRQTATSRVLGSQTTYVLIALAILVIGMSIAASTFLSAGNLSNATRNFSYIAIAALGQTIVIITAGIDLSVGSVMALAMLILSKIMTATAEWGLFVDMPWLALAAAVGGALLIAALIGAINGVLIAYVGLSPFVTTLGMLSCVRSICYVITEGRTSPTVGPAKDLFRALGNGNLIGVPASVIYMIVLAILCGIMLRQTRWGRHVFAIGGNEKAAALTGVPVERIKVSVYVLCSVLAGFSGILLLAWLGAAPANTAVTYELKIIAGSVIGGANLLGGTGGPVGAVAGAALIEVIRNGLVLAGVASYWQDFFVGAFIILAVLVDRLRARRGT